MSIETLHKRISDCQINQTTNIIDRKEIKKLTINVKKYEIPSIQIQAVIAMLLINLFHKFVREIPGSQNLSGDQGTLGAIVTSLTAIILVICIVLLLFKIKVALLLGLIPAAWAMLQWILVHVILEQPDQNGIWWYPIFPILQGILIIYFSIIAWKSDESFTS